VAFAKSLEEEKFPLGVLYVNPRKPAFEGLLPVYRQDSTPLIGREVNQAEVGNLLVELGA